MRDTFPIKYACPIWLDTESEKKNRREKKSENIEKQRRKTTAENNLL